MEGGGGSSYGALQVGFGLGFLVGWGLRYRLLWFFGHGLRSWIEFFGEMGVEVLVVVVWVLRRGAWLDNGDPGHC